MKIGVLDVQGDVSEHVTALKKAASSLGLKHPVVSVKDPDSIRGLGALVLPGGESTTIGMLVERFGLRQAICELASQGIPMLGTCAGLVLMASAGNSHVLKTGQPLLSLMDVKVSRNAFGRQRESFEADLEIPAIGGGAYPGVFIRAPAIVGVWGRAEALCELEGKIVMARQDNLIAVAFHPELTDDLRVHEYFLDLI